jgi:hypothetical protein
MYMQNGPIKFHLIKRTLKTYTKSRNYKRLGFLNNSCEFGKKMRCEAAAGEKILDGS